MANNLVMEGSGADRYAWTNDDSIDHLSGDMVLMGDAKTGFCLVDIAVGATGEVIAHNCAGQVAATPGEVWVVGEMLYLNPATDLVTNVPGAGNILIGAVWFAKAGGAVVGYVRMF